MTIFIDTSAFYAILDTAAVEHEAAGERWAALLSPRWELHDLIECLTDEEARRLTAVLRERGNAHAAPRPLTADDIILPEPILPDDETADEMIATVRRWRREGGCA